MILVGLWLHCLKNKIKNKAAYNQHKQLNRLYYTLYIYIYTTSCTKSRSTIHIVRMYNHCKRESVFVLVVVSVGVTVDAGIINETL